jgi:hypothetical protein
VAGATVSPCASILTCLSSVTVLSLGGMGFVGLCQFDLSRRRWWLGCRGGGVCPAGMRAAFAQSIQVIKGAVLRVGIGSSN